MNDHAIAKAHGLNSIQVTQVLNGKLKFSNRVIERVLGEDWQEVRAVYLKRPDYHDPLPDQYDHLVLRYPPRQCPITDQWFVPRQANERFYPGLSAAVKRAARRDITTARRRYAHEGDWGKEQQA